MAGREPSMLDYVQGNKLVALGYQDATAAQE
jgi:hypothetical protein